MASLILCCAAVTACDGATSGGGDLPFDDDPGAEQAVAPAEAPTILAQARDEATLPGIGDGELGGRGSPSSPGLRDAGIAIPSLPTTPRGGAVGSVDSVGGDFGGVRSGSTAAPAPTAPTSVGRSAEGSSARPAAPSGGVSDVSGGVSILPPGRPPTTTPRPPYPTPQPGTLTAGTWDDNRNYEFFTRYRQQIAQNVTGALPFADSEFQRAYEQSRQQPGARGRLDVALVIDTTGSMGDEIRYLQSEFVAISRAIEAAYPQSEQRWALVTYRDEGDEYVARYFDFRGEPQAFRDKLSAQYAAGGGDFPEAPQAAFAILNQFAWRTAKDVAKLAFWVADAPHHTQYASALAKGIRESRDLGIHVYPVASSGVDELTELTMRSAAQLTLGRYIFLTDDSRVGNAHKEPTIPCYFVTKLDDALLRAVQIEMTGIYREPDPQRVLRIQGDPQRGACALSSGQTVRLF
ncbi:MAG: vWA domain-containing protein [Polyangiales bacterium]